MTLGVGLAGLGRNSEGGRDGSLAAGCQSGGLLGGIPGTMPGRVTIIGAGNSGANACRMAAGMGARVTILDLDTRKLELLDEEYRGLARGVNTRDGGIVNSAVAKALGNVG